MQNNRHSERDRKTEADRILDRVEQESETVGTSSFGRVAERVKGHMNPENADQNDWAEVWGTRIGRGLGLVFVVILVIHLVITYLLN